MDAVAKGLTYPLRTVPLLFIAAFTILMSASLYAGFQGIPMILGLPLATILISWFLKYAFVLFDAISLGLREPPVLSYEMVNPFNEQRPLGQFFIVLVYYGASELIEPVIGGNGVTAVRFAGLLLLPASVATLGVTGSLLQAVNPLILLPLVYRLNWHYLVVVACAVVFGAAVFWIRSKSYFDLFFSIPLLVVAVTYAWLAMFTIFASVLYARRDRIGLETWFSPEQSEAKAQAEVERQRDRVVDEFYSHWRIRSYANAWAAVERHIASVSNATDDYLWIHERTARWPDARFAEKIAQELLPRLLAAGRNSEALDVVRARLKANAAFRPKSGAHLVRLVHLAADGGDKPTARALLKDFEQHYPEDRAQPIVARLRDGLLK